MTLSWSLAPLGPLSPYQDDKHVKTLRLGLAIEVAVTYMPLLSLPYLCAFIYFIHLTSSQQLSAKHQLWARP